MFNIELNNNDACEEKNATEYVKRRFKRKMF